AREARPAHLREVHPGRDSELGGEPLDEHRHKVREQDYPEQRIAELSAASDVRREVTGVDVGDRRDERRAEKRKDCADAPACAGERLARRSLHLGVRQRRDVALLVSALHARFSLHSAGSTKRRLASPTPSTRSTPSTRTETGPSNGSRPLTSTTAPGTS